MAEEIIFLSKEIRNINEVGDFLIKIGEKLKNQESFNLVKEGKNVEVSPKGSVKLELEYKIKNNEKHEFEIEIEWKPSYTSENKVDVS